MELSHFHSSENGTNVYTAFITVAPNMQDQSKPKDVSVNVAPTVPTMIRLPAAYRERLEKIADAQQRSLSNLCSLALSDWLDRQPTS